MDSPPSSAAACTSTSVTGRVYSLDAATGCTLLDVDAQAPVAARDVRRAGPGMPARRSRRVFFGDDSATIYALNATTASCSGSSGSTRILPRGSAARRCVLRQASYVPVSSLEELAAAAPGYECCKFRGSVAALRDARRQGDLADLHDRQEGHALPQSEGRHATLWAGRCRRVVRADARSESATSLYVGTGNSYTDEPAPRTNSILAMSMDTGRILLVATRFNAHDNYIVGCEVAPGVRAKKARRANCPRLTRRAGRRLRHVADPSHATRWTAGADDRSRSPVKVHALDPQTRQGSVECASRRRQLARRHRVGSRRPMPRRCMRRFGRS